MEKELFRAWSNDWTKSLTFDSDIINSKVWVKFKAHLTKVLGNEYNWERAMNSAINSDLSHFKLDSFITIK